jgi:hypothetical protein
MEKETAPKLTRSTDFFRYLGVDVRPRGFGFVVIESSSVLDSGVRMCDECDDEECLGQRFTRILQAYIPAVMILRIERHSLQPKKIAILNQLKKRAKQHDVEIVCKSPKAIRKYFGFRDIHTKQEIAHAVAAVLPELAWKLPPRRRPWETENHRMSIFDAAAAVVVHFETG